MSEELTLARPAARENVLWRAFAPLLVRIPATPVEALAAWRLDDAIRAHEVVRSAEARLEALRPSLVEAFAHLVPRTPDRGAALSARRAVYNGRDPGPAVVEGVAAVDPELGGRLQEWRDAVLSHRAATASRDRRFAKCCAETTARILDAALADPVAAHLALEHPELLRRLRRLAQRAGPRSAEPGEPPRLRSRDRRALGAAARTLWRSALRATPCDFLAGTAGGHLADVTSYPLVAGERHVDARPREEWLRAMGRAALRSPAVQSRVPTRPRADVLTVGGVHLLPPSEPTAADYRVVEPSAAREWALHPGDRAGADAGQLARVLWESMPDDFGLLEVIAALEGQAEPAQSAARPAVDTFIAGNVPVPHGEVAPFLDAIAHYGGRVEPGPPLEHRVLAALFGRLYGQGARVPLLRFHHDYVRACRSLGLRASPWLNVLPLARHLDVVHDDAVATVTAQLEELLREGVETVVYRPPTTHEGGLSPMRSGRLSLRFRPLGGGRCQLTFYGGPYMSLVARFARLPMRDGADLATRFADWMSQWPEVADVLGALGHTVDVRPRVTRHTIELPGEDAAQRGFAPSTLRVSEDHGRLRVMAADGSPLRPVFFGVSHARRLPPLAGFLCHLADFPRSLLEVVLMAVNAVHLDRLGRDEVSRLPTICLTEHIVVSPASVIVPSRMLAGYPTPVDAATFFAVRDALVALGVPSGPLYVRAGAEDREPLAVDPAHPEGVHALVRSARRGLPLTITPWQGAPCRFDLEVYAELAVEAAP